MAENDINLHVVWAGAWAHKEIDGEDRFLMAQRAGEDPQAPGMWAMPGGKVDNLMGLDVIEQTIAEELRQEIGIEIDLATLKYLASQAFIRTSGDHVVSLMFTAEWASGEAQPLEDQQAVDWKTISELEQIITEQNLKHFAGALLKLKSLYEA